MRVGKEIVCEILWVAKILNMVLILTIAILSSVNIYIYVVYIKIEYLAVYRTFFIEVIVFFFATSLFSIAYGVFAIRSIWDFQNKNKASFKLLVTINIISLLLIVGNCYIINILSNLSINFYPTYLYSISIGIAVCQCIVFTYGLVTVVRFHGSWMAERRKREKSEK